MLNLFRGIRLTAEDSLLIGETFDYEHPELYPESPGTDYFPFLVAGLIIFAVLFFVLLGVLLVKRIKKNRSADQ